MTVEGRQEVRAKQEEGRRWAPGWAQVNDTRLRGKWQRVRDGKEKRSEASKYHSSRGYRSIIAAEVTEGRGDSHDSGYRGHSRHHTLAKLKIETRLTLNTYRRNQRMTSF
jgi:hypothetical protein